MTTLTTQIETLAVAAESTVALYALKDLAEQATQLKEELKVQVEANAAQMAAIDLSSTQNVMHVDLTEAQLQRVQLLASHFALQLEAVRNESQFQNALREVFESHDRVAAIALHRVLRNSALVAFRSFVVSTPLREVYENVVAHVAQKDADSETTANLLALAEQAVTLDKDSRRLAYAAHVLAQKTR